MEAQKLLEAAPFTPEVAKILKQALKEAAGGKYSMPRLSALKSASQTSRLTWPVLSSISAWRSGAW
jgi:hypothetical protein